MRALKIRTRQGMISLTGDEAGALRDLLGQVRSGKAAGGTLFVSSNASTSITFTEVEKAAVLDVLDGRLEPSGAGAGLVALKNALASDLGRA
jgi:hypothetical protein